MTITAYLSFEFTFFTTCSTCLIDADSNCTGNGISLASIQDAGQLAGFGTDHEGDLSICSDPIAI